MSETLNSSHENIAQSSEVEKGITTEQQKAQEILNKVKKSGNYDLYDKMREEYKKLNYDKIKELYINISKEDIQNIKGDNIISYGEYKLKRNNLGELENLNKIYSNAKDSSNKAIIEEGKIKFEQLMGYISTWGEVKVSKEMVLDSAFHNLNELNKTQLNTKQQIFIDKILGTSRGFNDYYIKGFNTEKGKYLIKMSDFENDYKSKDIQSLNSLELGNYIKHLSLKKDNKSISIINTIRIKLGPDTKFFDEIEDKIIINYIKKTFEDAEIYFDTFIDNLFNFDDINIYINNFKQESKEEQEIIIEHLKENNDNHRGIFLLSIEESLPDKYSENKKEIAKNLLENLIESTAENAIIKLEAFKEKFNSNIDSQDTLKELGELQINDTKLKAVEALQSGENKLAEQLLEKARITQLGFKKANLLSITQFTALSNRLQNGESFDDVIQDISQENEELKELLEKEKSNTGVGNDEGHDDNNEENEHDNYNIDEDDYTPSNGGYSVQLKHGENFPGLIITPEEKKLTMGNPEALKNLVDFYQFFKELNLEGVWKYRKELALSMGDVNINLNDNDSVSKTELLKFGNALINIINNITEEEENKNTLKRTNSISAMKNELRKYSGANSDLSNEQTYNIQGEDKFTASLRNNGIIGGAYFHTAQLRKLTK